MSVGMIERDADHEAGEKVAGNSTVDVAPEKQDRFDRCFTGLDIKLGKGPLKDMDPDKLKREIQRWAKAVVAYARQLSFKSPRTPSSRRGADRESSELTNEEERSK
ncbi:hypothetical protein FCM35_KLT15491 [Carex littledalei]|uniref:Uncharacterized protein n=1 Tax=Carex littledalei TaxID=544730 RepID=A0A833VS61_9POAL|nr:hypothetical protein FCM35_KLT15491 [Carex littledalei]